MVEGRRYTLEISEERRGRKGYAKVVQSSTIMRGRQRRLPFDVDYGNRQVGGCLWRLKNGGG